MIKDELMNRIQRMYALMNALEESDLTKFKPFWIATNSGIGFYQDWRGGLSDEELSNYAYSLINIVAHFGNHLRKWADTNGKDKTKIDDCFNNSHALKIVTDLSNIEKHAYPNRRHPHSGLAPRLGEISRSLQLKAGGGSSVSFTIDAQGNPKTNVSGTGSVNVVITCDILDEHSNVIGKYDQIMSDAVSAWENVISEFGFSLS